MTKNQRAAIGGVITIVAAISMGAAIQPSKPEVSAKVRDLGSYATIPRRVACKKEDDIFELGAAVMDDNDSRTAEMFDNGTCIRLSGGPAQIVERRGRLVLISFTEANIRHTMWATDESISATP